MSSSLYLKVGEEASDLHATICMYMWRRPSDCPMTPVNLQGCGARIPR